jgi:hypothetical protein
MPTSSTPKFTQIGVFGLKISHLATLLMVGRGFDLTQFSCTQAQRVISHMTTKLIVFNAAIQFLSHTIKIF